MNRRDTVFALLALGGLPLAARAQLQSRVRRIGFLIVRPRSTPSNPDVYYDAFVQGMHDLGYMEGRNLIIDWRSADGKFERLPGLASELVQTNPEVILTHTTPGTAALQRATSTIPIVMTSIVDPVGSGFAKSLAQPGGNITGLSIITIDLSPKYLELLKTMVPALSRVAFLVNPVNSTHPATLKSVQAAAGQRGVKVLPVAARTADEIERAFGAMRRERAEALIVPADGYFVGLRRQITELAAESRLPSMYSFREYVEAGGLMSYGQNLIDFLRHAATYVDKILKGAKPSEMPIEQPTRIHLAINRRAAKGLGITVPQELLLRADEVID